MGKQWKQWETLILDSKVTTDGDCSHEIKRRLLLGRKAVTNLDSILKSRDIFFANKGPSSQSFGFSRSHVWMWELDYKDSWALKNWCFWTVVLETTLESPLGCKEIQAVHLKGNQFWVFIGRTDRKLKLQYFGHLLWRTDSFEKTDAGKDRRWEEKRMTEDVMVGWHHQLGGHEFEQALGVGDGQGSLACYSPWGCKESDTTESLNWTELHLFADT